YLFWGGLALPAESPRAIVDRLHAETQKALAVPAVQERLATFGVEPMPMTVDGVGKFYRDDVGAIVKLAEDIKLGAANVIARRARPRWTVDDCNDGVPWFL